MREEELSDCPFCGAHYPSIVISPKLAIKMTSPYNAIVMNSEGFYQVTCCEYMASICGFGSTKEDAVASAI